MSLWRGEKVQAFLAEFTDVWLLPARPAGGMWPVIPLIFVQSLIVLCAAAMLAGLKPQPQPFMRAWRTGSSPARQSREVTREIGLEILATRRPRRHGACVSGAGRHRDHVVARDVGGARQAAGKAGGRFQCVAVRLPDRADLQGQLHRDGDGGD